MSRNELEQEPRVPTNPLADLSFAELLLVGTHIEGAGALVNEELERREATQPRKEQEL